jgi:hypothetical protein
MSENCTHVVVESEKWRPEIVDFFIVLLVQLGVSVVSWLASMLSLNRLSRIRRFTPAELYGALLYAIAAIVRTFAALATKSGSYVTQACTAFVGSTVSWVSFIVIYNNEIVLPTKQQLNAIALSVAATGFWEMQNYIVIHHL